MTDESQLGKLNAEIQEWAAFLNTNPARALREWLAELHPDLRTAVHSYPNGRVSVEHPFFLNDYAVCLPASHINRGCESARKAAAEFRKEENWHSCVFIHVRPFRLHALLEIAAELSDDQYWQMLSNVWTDSENIYQNVQEWLQALSSSRAKKESFMEDEERALFQSLPEQITVYRGYQPGKNRKGLSWSLSKEVAIHLSNNVVPPGTDWKLRGTGGRLRQKTIAKGEAFAYLNGREEQEIIFLGDYS